MLGIIFWGYLCGQIPAGILIKKFNVRWVLFAFLLLLSFSTILVPFAAKQSIYLFYILRVLTGFGAVSVNIYVVNLLI